MIYVSTSCIKTKNLEEAIESLAKAIDLDNDQNLEWRNFYANLLIDHNYLY